MITANVPIIKEPTGLETNVFRQPGSADKSSVNISWSPPNPLGKFIFLLNPTAISYASKKSLGFILNSMCVRHLVKTYSRHI